MKIVFTLMSLLILSTHIALAADNEQTVTFNVENMSCATCPIVVRKAMQAVDGVKTVSVDLPSKTATVIYDAAVTTVARIGAASTGVGFPAAVKDGDGA